MPINPLQVRVEFRLTQHYSKYGLKDAINRMWYQGSSTRTGDALMTLKNDVFTTRRGMRDDKSIPKVGFLFHSIAVTLKCLTPNSDKELASAFY